MSRRRVLVGLVVLAAVALITILLWPRAPRLSREKFQQVHEGMTDEEVWAKVGEQPRRQFSGPLTAPGHSKSYARADLWQSSDVGLAVYYDDSGRAAHVFVFEVIRPPAWAPIRDRLGL
jgi:hypothetical protein